MRFVKTQDLKTGMRIARPIYNKKGVLLYDRDSKLTSASISSIQNFGLIGIFVLEPAEPLPPMTEEDVEFERFQAVNVFAIRDELKEIVATRRAHRVEAIANEIVKSYGHLHHRINFIQNIRSREDYVFKHSLNVAILAAMMCKQMNAQPADITDCLTACLVHDIGKITVPDNLLQGEDAEETERILDNAQETGFELLETVFASNANIKRICVQTKMLLDCIKFSREPEKMKILLGTRVMLVAETFDSMTAMSTSGDVEPASYVETLRYLLKYPEIFNKKAVEALVNSIEILSNGTSVELNNGHTALVLNTNTGDILYPMVLELGTNQIMDLSDRRMFGDIEIVDAVKKMDKRYVMSDEELKKLGLK